jgi:hypothetical protein
MRQKGEERGREGRQINKEEKRERQGYRHIQRKSKGGIGMEGVSNR